MAGRGGVWFENERVKIHVGVDPDFRPARKAHPALVVLLLFAGRGRYFAFSRVSAMLSCFCSVGSTSVRRFLSLASVVWSRAAVTSATCFL